MPAVKSIKHPIWLVIAVVTLAAVIFVAHESLKPNLDEGVSYYQNEDCEPFQGNCVARSGINSVNVSLGDRRIESMTEIPIRVELENTTADAVVVDFEGLDMYMGRVRTELTRGHDGQYQGAITLPSCGTGKMLWRARVLLAGGTVQEGVRFDFWAE